MNANENPSPEQWGKQYGEKAHFVLTVSFKRIFAGLAIGSIVGLAGTAFAHSLAFVNHFREVHPQVLFVLPFAGLLIVFLYHFFKNQNDKGTNMVISSIHSSENIPFQMAPLIFITTLLTHLCGGSSGREGAAIQLGGSIANHLGTKLKLTPNEKRIVIMCGMSAGFSALFGTPMAAAIFALEVVSIGIMHYSALVPCVISSYTAYFIAQHFHVAAEVFTVKDIVAATPISMGRTLLFGISLAVVSILFCKILHFAEHTYRTKFKNPYVRIFVAGCLVILCRFVLQTDLYLGSGTVIIEHIFHEETIVPYAFLLKMIFTALTLGAGFKGGEIVPSFCIGAAFGCAVAPLTGLSVTLSAACGMVGVFCGVTNCPITSLLIAFELFGFEGMPYYLMTIAISYMLSGYTGLYRAQKIIYSKTETQFINRNTQ